MKNYLIDIVGTCNLRCPSCPVGNYQHNQLIMNRKKGFMSFDLFQKIIHKIQADCSQVNENFSISLYNWGEPLIHPNIVEIVEFLHNQNIAFSFSTNLNIKDLYKPENEQKLLRILQTFPTMIRISVSGFEQEIYQRGHKGGDIELVKKNMEAIANLINNNATLKDFHKRTHLHVFYLIYTDNCDDNIAKMYDFCKQLNFDFIPGIAYLMPLEKMIYGVDENKLNEEDKQTLQRLYISPKEAFMMLKDYSAANNCPLFDDIVINHDGSVALCCSVYDPALQVVADNYLNYSLKELQKCKQQKSALCKICTKNNMQLMALQVPEDIWKLNVLNKQKIINTKYLTDIERYQRQTIKNPIRLNPNYKK